MDDFNVGETKEAIGTVVFDGKMLEAVNEVFKEGRFIAGNFVLRAWEFYESSMYLYLMTDLSGNAWIELKKFFY